MVKIFLVYFFVFVDVFGNGNIDSSVHLKNKNFFVKPLRENNFCYVEFTAFPTQIEENTFGAAIGYRIAVTESMGNDFSFHIMKTTSGDLNICGKANHLFYVLERNPIFSPYIGFGIIAGVAPENDKLIYRSTKDYEDPNSKNDYALMVNGEIVIGVEFTLNEYTKQFFELTYYAQSPTLQLSFGIGF